MNEMGERRVGGFPAPRGREEGPRTATFVEAQKAAQAVIASAPDTSAPNTSAQAAGSPIATPIAIPATAPMVHTPIQAPVRHASVAEPIVRAPVVSEPIAPRVFAPFEPTDAEIRHEMIQARLEGGYWAWRRLGAVLMLCYPGWAGAIALVLGIAMTGWQLTHGHHIESGVTPILCGLGFMMCRLIPLRRAWLRGGALFAVFVASIFLEEAILARHWLP